MQIFWYTFGGKVLGIYLGALHMLGSCFAK